jgi:hypothetical protein
LLSGASPAAPARQYALSADSIWRHSVRHLRQAVPAAIDATETGPGGAEAEAGGAMAGALTLQLEALAVLRKARRVGALDVALRAIDQSAKLLELAARLQGRLDTGARIQIGMNIGAEATRERITERLNALRLPSAIDTAAPVIDATALA